MGAKVHNIDGKITAIGNCINDLEDLISVTTASMFDDSSGLLDDLKTLLYDTKTKLETTKETLTSLNNSLKNNYDNKYSNPDDYRWYLREDGWNG